MYVSRRLRTTAVIARHSQTELAINTHVAVSETRTVVSNIHTMVSDLHRGQEGNDSKVAVSDIPTPTTTE